MVAPKTYANHVAMHCAIDAAVVLKKKGMGSRELLVHLIIARHANREGACWLSHDTIAKESASSRWTSMRATRNLAEGGLISIEEHKSGANFYRLLEGDNNLAVANSNGFVADSTRPVADSTTLVADSSCLGSNLLPEVVPSVVKEVVKGSNTLTSSPQGRTKSRIHLSDFATETKNKQQQEQHPSNIKPQTEKITNPHLAKLACRYHELLGHPPTQLKASAEVWPGLFQVILAEYSLDDLSAAIEWAFLEDQFWPRHLFRRKGDPVEYFVEKIDSIMTSWRMHKQKQTNLRNSPQTTALTPSQQKVANIFSIT
jgi:hypothetical protein